MPRSIRPQLGASIQSLIAMQSSASWHSKSAQMWTSSCTGEGYDYGSADTAVRLNLASIGFEEEQMPLMIVLPVRHLTIHPGSDLSPTPGYLRHAFSSPIGSVME